MSIEKKKSELTNLFNKFYIKIKDYIDNNPSSSSSSSNSNTAILDIKSISYETSGTINLNLNSIDNFPSYGYFILKNENFRSNALVSTNSKFVLKVTNTQTKQSNEFIFLDNINGKTMTPAEICEVIPQGKFFAILYFELARLVPGLGIKNIVQLMHINNTI